MASSFFLALLAVLGVIVGSSGQIAKTPLTGGLSDIDVNHHTVQDLIKALPSMTNELNGFEIIKVVRAQIQVVAGFVYVLTIQTREQGSNGPATQECEASIWIQSWLEKQTLTSFKCKSMNKPGIPGGWHKGVITDLVKKTANIGLELLNRKCNCMFRKSITKVKKVLKKVVAGLLLKITVELVDSSCRNSEANQWKSLEECPARENAVAKECEITMIFAPWQSPIFRLIEHTCH